MYITSELVTSAILLSRPYLAFRGLVARPTTNIALPRETSSIILCLVTLWFTLVGLEARPLGCGPTWWILLGSGTWYLLTTPLQLLAPSLERWGSTRQWLVASRARIVRTVVPFCPFCHFV